MVPSGARQVDGRAGRPGGRHAARLAAVQAIYQIDAAGAAVEQVLTEFMRHRIDSPEGEDSYAGADRVLFADIVRGVAERRAALEEMLASALAESWTVERLDRVLRAILLAGAYEIVARTDIPPRVIISEYIDLAHAFFDGREPAMVNGVLDRLAHVVRRDELGDGRP
jgi:transcription antitermination protein NusB